MSQNDIAYLFQWEQRLGFGPAKMFYYLWQEANGQIEKELVCTNGQLQKAMNLSRISVNTILTKLEDQGIIQLVYHKARTQRVIKILTSFVIE